MMPTIYDAVLALVPGATILVSGDTVTWISPAEPPVTLAQIAAQLALLQAEAAWDPVRAWRELLLGAYDKVRLQIQRQQSGAVPLHPIDDATVAAWLVWAQALADIPEAYASPAAVIWPAPPASPGVAWPAFPAGIGTLAPGWPLI